MALHQSSVAAEEKMVRATNLYERPSIRRQAIVNRMQVGRDLTAFRVGLMAVVAQQEHERPRTSNLRGKQCGCGAAKGVAEDSYAGQVEPSRELAGCIRAVQLLQPIKDERNVRSPRRQQPVRTTVPLRARFLEAEFGVVLRNPPHHPELCLEKTG